MKKGVIGIITNNSFVDGLIHRGMREELMNTFDEIYILNLHGNANKGDSCPDGSKDENVFDIRQGVCISFFVKTGKKTNKNKGVYCFSLQGVREKKYSFLYDNTVSSVQWEKLNAVTPDFWFVKKEFVLEEKYKSGWSLTNIFSSYNNGIQTGRDNLFTDLDKDKLELKIKRLFSGDYDDSFADYYNVKNTGGFALKDRLKKYSIDKNYFQLTSYRPFDDRNIYYHLNIIRRPSQIMLNFIGRENIGLVFCRQLASNKWQHAFVTDKITDGSFISLKTKEWNYIAPLYLYPDEKEIQPDKSIGKRVNFTESFQKYINDLYKFNPTPEQILGYIYAILYAPSFRTKYYEFLKIDFPRIPFTEDENLFKTLSEKGTELISLHLLKTDFEKSVVNFPVENPDLKVESVKYKDKKIWFNKTAYFDNVPEAVWKYEIGGYQVLDKWLKERKKHGCTLTGNDLRHFMNICNSLNETIKIQNGIDKLIKE